MKTNQDAAGAAGADGNGFCGDWRRTRSVLEKKILTSSNARTYLLFFLHFNGVCRCSSSLLTLEQLKARLPDGIPPELASVGSLSVFSINLLSNQCIKPAQQSAQLHRKMHLRAPRLSARDLVRHISTAISYNCKNTFFITN